MTDALNKIPLCCPLDGLALVRQQRSFSCANNHSYDIARQGYVNLLPVQFKSSKDPGDSKSMVAARQAVLSQGHYCFLADTLCDLVVDLFKNTQTIAGAVIDAGCGDGYYSARLQQCLLSEFGERAIAVLAMDISKWSVLAAARTHKQLACAVATNTHLPVLQGTAVLITSLFGFSTWPAWGHQQTPGQWVVLADPGPDHLLELRQLIYDEVRVHDLTDDPAAKTAGYLCTVQRQVTYTTLVDSTDALLAILEMTPHGRRVTAEKRTALQTIGSLSLTIDVMIRVFEKQERDPVPQESHQD